MSHPSQNTSLSLSARLLCYLGPPSTILLTSIASPRAALLSPFTFLPTAWFARKWLKSNKVNSSRRGRLEPMVWTYAAAGTLGLTAVVLVQMGIVKAASALIFRSTQASDDFWTEFGRTSVKGLTADQIKHRATLAASWQNWVLNGLISFFTAGLVEETLKYLPVIYARRGLKTEQGRQRNRAYIDYVFSAALSFGLVEGIAFVYVACEQNEESWAKLALTVLERVVLGQVGHLAVAALTALRATRRDFYGDNLSLAGVIGPAIFFHGLWDFGALTASTLEGNPGFIHPAGIRNTAILLGLAFGMVGIAITRVNQEWKALDSRDRAYQPLEDESSED